MKAVAVDVCIPMGLDCMRPRRLHGLSETVHNKLCVNCKEGLSKGYGRVAPGYPADRCDSTL
eukprot:1180181-Prorocentrum_minimum.AAC.4